MMYVLLAAKTRRDPDQEPSEDAPKKEPLLIENL